MSIESLDDSPARFHASDTWVLRESFDRLGTLGELIRDILGEMRALEPPGPNATDEEQRRFMEELEQLNTKLQIAYRALAEEEHRIDDIRFQLELKRQIERARQLLEQQAKKLQEELKKHGVEVKVEVRKVDIHDNADGIADGKTDAFLFIPEHSNGPRPLRSLEILPAGAAFSEENLARLNAASPLNAHLTDAQWQVLRNSLVNPALPGGLAAPDVWRQTAGSLQPPMDVGEFTLRILGVPADHPALADYAKAFESMAAQRGENVTPEQAHEFAWRLAAGYRVGKPTYFLNDADSNWASGELRKAVLHEVADSWIDPRAQHALDWSKDQMPGGAQTGVNVNNGLNSKNSNCWNNWCLAFVNTAYGRQIPELRAETAIGAYENFRAEGRIVNSRQNIPPGAPLFFAPSVYNGGCGHVVIFTGRYDAHGDPIVRSNGWAGNPGIHEFSLKEMERLTGAYLGYGVIGHAGNPNARFKPAAGLSPIQLGSAPAASTPHTTTVGGPAPHHDAGPPPTTAHVSTQEVVPTRVEHNDKESEEVEQLQQLLRAYGFDLGDIAAGIMGPETKQALMALQVALGRIGFEVEPSGSLDAATNAALATVLADPKLEAQFEKLLDAHTEVDLPAANREEITTTSTNTARVARVGITAT